MSCSQQRASESSLALDRFRPGLYRFIRRRGFGRDEADDLTQETLLRAYQHLPGFRGDHLSAWLYRIAGNLCIDYNRRQRIVTVPLGEEITASPESDPADLLDRGERVRTIYRLVNQLPECHRRILQLRYFEERSMVDIAGRFNCSPLAAKLRVFRAVSALRRAWHDHHSLRH